MLELHSKLSQLLSAVECAPSHQAFVGYLSISSQSQLILRKIPEAGRSVAWYGDSLMEYAPGYRKKVTLTLHADHDVYIEHQFNKRKLARKQKY